MTEMQKQLWATHLEKGWNALKRSDLEELALVVTEVAEAMECLRVADHSEPAKRFWYQENGKPEGMRFELADVLIRVYNICSKHGWDAEQLIAVKNAYNKTRPALHGKRL